MSLIPDIVLVRYRETVDSLIDELGVTLSLHFIESGSPGAKNIYAGPQILNPKSAYMDSDIPTDNIETLKVRLYTDPKTWIKTIVPSTNATAQILGKLSDLPKLKRCDYVIYQNGDFSQKLTLAGSPQTYGFHMYFIVYLQEMI